MKQISAGPLPGIFVVLSCAPSHRRSTNYWKENGAPLILYWLFSHWLRKRSYIYLIIASPLFQLPRNWYMFYHLP